MRRPRGFTLIELLVALTIFAVLSLLSYGGLTSVLETSDRSSARMARLGELQRGVGRLVDDLRQLQPRPVRDAYGDPRAALVAAEERDPPLEFTRGGWPNPAGQPRSTLQRIEYRLDGRTLVRRAWPVLDRDPQSEPLEQRLLDGVETLALRYYDDQGRWQTFWPAAGAPPDDQTLPRGVELQLEIEGFGEVTRLVVPGG